MSQFMYSDLIGIPFVDGGRDKNGMDCWGLAKECFKRQGIMVKDYDISAMATAKIDCELQVHETIWQKLPAPTLGCLVLINVSCQGFANHVGVYVGNTKFIHAYANTGVCLSSIKRWHSHIKGYYLPPGVSAYDTDCNNRKSI
jgi:cell wall-associated NlpC family hydrolase